jgi:PAS domain S-box-containing protein
VRLSANLTRRLALLEVELGILARMVEALKNTSAIDAVLDELLFRCLDAAGISRGVTYLLEPDGQLCLRAQLGYPGGGVEPLTEFFGHAELLRQVMAQGEPVQIRLPEAPDARPADLLARAGAQSVLITPLVLGEQCLGVLGMASASRDLGEDWISFAKVVGSQLAQAVELARTLSRLSASERRYRDLVESLDAIVWEADAQTGQFTFVNRRAEQILGYPLARWLTEPNFLVNVIHPDDREHVVALRREAMAERRDPMLEYRVVAADGRVLWVHSALSPIRDEAGAVRQVRGVLVDITERKQREQYENELRLARRVQQRLYPHAMPRVPGYDIAGASDPAAATGGDHFDFIPMGDDRLGVVIGDVSGHGFGPALIMAETRAYLRALAWTHADPGAILTLANRILTGDIADRFITLLAVRLDLATRSLAYANAGHVAGFVLDAAGTVKARLEPGSPPWGSSPTWRSPRAAPCPWRPATWCCS